MKEAGFLVKSETEKAIFCDILTMSIDKMSAVWLPKAWLNNISEKRYVDKKTGISVDFSDRYFITAEISEKHYEEKIEESKQS